MFWCPSLLDYLEFQHLFWKSIVVFYYYSNKEEEHSVTGISFSSYTPLPKHIHLKRCPSDVKQNTEWTITCDLDRVP